MIFTDSPVLVEKGHDERCGTLVFHWTAAFDGHASTARSSFDTTIFYPNSDPTPSEISRQQMALHFDHFSVGGRSFDLSFAL